jgi:putative membrane protein
MENLALHLNVAAMLSTVVYSLIGLALFGLALLLMVKIAPFSVRKEIEEDQNTSLGIIMGSVFIALAIIIQAAMR